jgi:uncharacterized protein
VIASRRSRLHRLAVPWALAVAALWLFAAGASAQPAFPPLTGRVVDRADLLSPAVEAELTTKLEALEAESSDQVVVATIPDLQGYEIEEYGYQLGRAWGIGQNDTNNGVLLIVAPNERKVRIEVGYGLEGVLTDGLSGLIIQRQILPAFRDGDFERGVVQGVDAIDQQLRLDPAEAAARAAAVEQDAESAAAPAIGVAVSAFLLILFWIVVARSGGRRGRRRNDGVWIWAASEALRHAGRGGGGSSWGGGGGGGFGGGGGSFGGGGASGGW